MNCVNNIAKNLNKLMICTTKLIIKIKPEFLVC